jgi:putative transposase
MTRLSRIVIPGVPHHVTQRGNRRLPTFFRAEDYAAYLEFLKEGCGKTGTEVWAYCLMPNHVHLLLVPQSEDGLRATLGEAHRKYARMINFREEWRGHLWQERFASFPTDEAHTLNAARYIELNPVRAKLCDNAADYRWSSAGAHIHRYADPVLNTAALLRLNPEWSAFLQSGIDQSATDALHLHESTGRPLGSPDFIAKIEAMLGKPVTPQKAGRKPKEDK